MAIRRDKQAREGGYHWHDSWLIARKEDEAGDAAFFWSGTEWAPYDSDAKAFEIRKEAEELMAGFILTDPDPDRRNYRLEINSERYDNHSAEEEGCKWCREVPYAPTPKVDRSTLETLDGRKRQKYDEGSIGDRKD